ncbi:hypothetical protein Q3C01_44245 [Bradyrhizobium sp. UFLA05-109]
MGHLAIIDGTYQQQCDRQEESDDQEQEKRDDQGDGLETPGPIGPFQPLGKRESRFARSLALTVRFEFYNAAGMRHRFTVGTSL